MSRDFKKELRGFEQVWKRVAGTGPRLPEKLQLMPRKQKKDAPGEGKHRI